jgi:hypothetical protein
MQFVDCSIANRSHWLVSDDAITKELTKVCGQFHHHQDPWTAEWDHSDLEARLESVHGMPRPSLSVYDPATLRDCALIFVSHL